MALDKESISSLARGLRVIEVFDADHGEMTLSEIARRAELAPATARRCLRTLMTLGYVREANKRFLLAPRILALGSSFLRSARTDEALLPEIRRIVGLFGDATSVGVLTGADVLYIAHLSEERSGRPNAGVGVSYPACATSLGRVLLSHRSEAEIRDVLQARPPAALTDQTVTDPERMLRIILLAREQGFATARDQLAYGVTSIAVPIIGPSGQAIAAINSSGYSGRISEAEMIEQRLPELRIAASRIGRTLSRYPALSRSLDVEKLRIEEDGPGRPGAKPASRRQVATGQGSTRPTGQA